MNTRYQEEILFYEGSETMEQVPHRGRSILNFFPSNVLEDLFISKHM